MNLTVSIHEKNKPFECNVCDAKIISYFISTIKLDTTYLLKGEKEHLQKNRTLNPTNQRTLKCNVYRARNLKGK